MLKNCCREQFAHHVQEWEILAAGSWIFCKMELRHGKDAREHVTIPPDMEI